jgi:hypothetical protein
MDKMDFEKLVLDIDSSICAKLPEDIGIIAYVFDKSEDGLGSGFSRLADIEDALIAMKRIAKAFNIDINRFALAIQKYDL